MIESRKFYLELTTTTPLSPPLTPSRPQMISGRIARGKNCRHLMENRRLPRFPIPDAQDMSIPRRIQQIFARFSWESSDIDGGWVRTGNATWEFFSRSASDPHHPSKLTLFPRQQWTIRMMDIWSWITPARKSNYVVGLSANFIPTTIEQWMDNRFKIGTMAPGGSATGTAVILRNLTDS